MVFSLKCTFLHGFICGCGGSILSIRVNVIIGTGVLIIWCPTNAIITNKKMYKFFILFPLLFKVIYFGSLPSADSLSIRVKQAARAEVRYYYYLIRTLTKQTSSHTILIVNIRLSVIIDIQNVFLCFSRATPWKAAEECNTSVFTS